MKALNDMCQANRPTMIVSKTAPSDREVTHTVTGGHAMQNRSKLQPDEDEGENVEGEDDCFPDRIARHARRGRHSLWCESRERDRVADHRQHAG